jgi:hypothetical protein
VVTYLHVHEDADLSLGVFCLPRGACLPLHNHPNMTVLSRCARARPAGPRSGPALLVESEELCGACVLLWSLRIYRGRLGNPQHTQHGGSSGAGSRFKQCLLEAVLSLSLCLLLSGRQAAGRSCSFSARWRSRAAWICRAGSCTATCTCAPSTGRSQRRAATPGRRAARRSWRTASSPCAPRPWQSRDCKYDAHEWLCVHAAGGAAVCCGARRSPAPGCLA